MDTTLVPINVHGLGLQNDEIQLDCMHSTTISNECVSSLTSSTPSAQRIVNSEKMQFEGLNLSN